MTPIRTTLILIVLLATASAAGDDASGDITPLFTSNDLLEVTIRGPLTSIMDERSAAEDLAATLTYNDVEHGEVLVDIGVQARGRFRKQTRICRWAPLRLNFKKSKLDDTIFAGSDKMKLVTHCRNGSSRYTQAVLAEHLAYRIFNLVTDASFRVRLLRITYVDTDEQDRTRVELGFLIEHKDQLARRIGLETNEMERTTVDALHARHTNLGSLYQYLIGNSDFSPIQAPPGEPCCHNYVLFGAEPGGILAVPYDFDMSGIVDAPHSAPNPRFGLRDAQDRIYRGRCVNNEHLGGSVQAFRDNRDAIYSMINDNALFEPRKRKNLLRFLDDFYATIENSNRLRASISDRCLS